MITSGRFARAGQEPDNQLFFDFGPDEPEKPTAPIEITPTPANYRITENTIGIGGAKTKFNRNIVAIRTLKQIEAENRKAAPLEQEILARYVGWGALPQAFDENNRDWKTEYADLKALLTEEEYLAARGSTLNAHYTSPLIARLLVETLGRMGFKSGNILEPSCGTGNFFGVLPERMSQSRLYGVELDSLTGRIARLLYPNAGIAIDGFENARFPDNFFDIAIGNVPFGQYKVLDREHRYDRENFNIHDFFFAKTLDKVRPGGIVAFITSKWTMDKANPAIRIYMAQRAVLLGAVRLPNNAFKANAGTEVTADILFLQKRDAPVEDVRLEEWIPIKADSNGILVNDYFNLHPEMLLGTMIRNDAYRNETECRPFEGRDLEELLKTALGRIQGQYIGRKAQTREQAKESIPADTRVRNFSYTLVNGVLYYRENSVMNRPKLPAMEIARAKGMVELRDACRAVIDIQLKSYNDAELRACQERLNDVYDRFVSRYGRVNDPANARAFDADSSYYLLCALENLDENRQFKSKSDMFTKRTIRQHIVPSSVDTPQEALLLSISERARVDLPYMSSLTGRTEDELIRELQTEIFPVPGTDEYQTADEYLSGNVREKLETARQYAEGNPGRFRGNVEALEKAQPVPLNATDIDARLGSTWIEPKFIQDFIYELLQTPYYAQGRIEVRYSPLTSIWNVSGKSIDSGNILANTAYGTPDASAYKIIEDSLNLRAVKIYRTEKDSEGKDRRVLDPDATAIAQQKQEEIKQKFRDWIFAAPYRREALVGEYNRRFNSTRAREYDGSHLTFSGINPNIELRPHQKDAIARILYGGNTLLAHEVGAGKTFVAVAAAMEKKRLGLAHKTLFVVPNHLIEQTAIETIRLYPGANILVAAKRDFEKSNRKKFCARIATGDYDIIIIGHSQFEKIPLSLDRQEWFIQEQIDEILTAIQEVKDERGERWSIKQMEASRKNLEAKL
ncbi:MAG: DEAD/DEAH box helicase family protein, partial [Synergistaceae bacterium]|nr:DEAD/DEAH box helicase family protein [Synergistaceae bacterium]